MLACLGLVTLVVAVLAPISPPIKVGDGLGFDGQQYAQMVRDMREGANVPVSSLAAYRVLVPAVVAASGLDVRAGFLLVDLLGIALGALGIQWLLRRRGATPALALLGVGWWLVLPFGLRAAITNPVLVDAPAAGFMVALAVVATERRAALFALLLGLAVLVRENLVVMVPFLFLTLAGPVPKRTVLTIAATLPAIVALAWVRSAGPIPADPVIPLLGAALLNGFIVLLNIDEHAWRYALAALFTFGVLPAASVARLGTVADVVRREPAWAYLAVAVLATGVVGGMEHDRYLAPLGLPLLIVAFTPGVLPAGRVRLAILSALHVAVSVALFPVGVEAASSAARTFSSMAADRLPWVALAAAAGAAAAWVGVVGWRIVAGSLTRSVQRMAGARTNG